MAANNILRSFRRFGSSSASYGANTIERSELPADAVILRIKEGIPGVIYAEEKCADPKTTGFNYNPTKEILIGTALGLAVGFAWKWQHWQWKQRVADYYKEMAEGRPDDWETAWTPRGEVKFG